MTPSQGTGDGDVRTRFAPSPTGYLHVGGARTALFNWLYARRHGGAFILRIEDTDASRNIEAGLAAITRGLRWMGIDWDEGPEAGGDRGPYFQSQRREIYDRHFATLERKDLVYVEENGAARFRSPRQPVVVDDRICGRIEFERDEPDMTIRRPDGSYIFHFVNVVDDLEMGITHVIRGEDHLSNTPKHIELFQALGAAPPVYAHIPLILNEDGSKMSKRDAGASVQEYIDQGYLPRAVGNYLCLLGWSPKDDREKMDLAEITALFDFPNVNRSNASFDLRKCRWLNGLYLAALGDTEFVAHCLPELEKAGIPTGDEVKLKRILPLVQEKVQLASEIPAMIGLFFREECVYDDKALEKVRKTPGNGERLGVLREEFSGTSSVAWDEEAVGKAIDATVLRLGIKKGALMFPLRVAVSGGTAGPALLPMLEILGRETTLRRLGAAIDLVAD